jgi:hypothetical protein
MKLTDTNVARLKLAARGESRLVRDTDLLGFYVRVSHRNKVCKLQIDVRVDGKRKTLGWSWPLNKFTVKAARAAARKIVDKRDDGGTLQPEKAAAGITFAEAWPKYLVAKKTLRPRTIEHYEDILGLYLTKRWPERSTSLPLSLGLKSANIAPTPAAVSRVIAPCRPTKRTVSALSAASQPHHLKYTQSFQWVAGFARCPRTVPVPSTRRNPKFHDAVAASLVRPSPFGHRSPS